MENYFVELNNVNVNNHVEKKNGLSYVSWPYCWAEVKKRHPDATYTIYKNADGWFYHTDGKTCWVETGVTINGIEHIEYLPVMDYKNRSIAVTDVTSFDVNKAIQRSLTKACARHGLGLYIYAGEDLPEAEKPEAVACSDCGNGIVSASKRNGEAWPASEIADYSTHRFGRPLCPACQRKAFNAEKAEEKNADHG